MVFLDPVERRQIDNMLVDTLTRDLESTARLFYDLGWPRVAEAVNQAVAVVLEERVERLKASPPDAVPRQPDDTQPDGDKQGSGD